jgi:hypothetical protein
VNTPAAPTRNDPIRERFFAAVETAEGASDWLFWAAVALSLASFFAPGSKWAECDQPIQIVFLIVVFVMFALGLALRLYWMPRAEDERRRDFLSNAYAIALTHNQTTGYYNNNQTAPVRRVAANVMENSFFTKSIAGRMAVTERARVGVYTVVLVAVALYRGSDLGLIAIVAQTVLSEVILARWFRIEWLRARSERTYDFLHDLFRQAPTGAQFDVKASELYVLYETSKANAGVTLSAAIFEKLNPSLSTEWDDIKRMLNI